MNPAALSAYAMRFLGILLACYAVAIFLPIDPEEDRPGTRLSGAVAEHPEDWSFIKDSKLVTVQTSTWYLIPHSVTVTSWVAEGKYYLGCGRCATKVWPTHVARNPDVVVKIDGKLYEGRAFLATGAERRAALGVPLGDEIPDGAEAYRVDLR
jgi:hypothetical protein